jgi:hypothetical protein
MITTEATGRLFLHGSTPVTSWSLFRKNAGFVKADESVSSSVRCSDESSMALLQSGVASPTCMMVGVNVMGIFAATAVYPCKCGAETHSYSEFSEEAAEQVVSIHCWRCDAIISTAPAVRVWSASSAQKARRLRLVDLHGDVSHPAYILNGEAVRPGERPRA